MLVCNALSMSSVVGSSASWLPGWGLPIECPDYVELLFDRLTAQRITKGLDGTVALPSAVDGKLSNGLDALKGFLAGLPVDDLAEQAARETDVFTQFVAARCIEVAGD